VVVAELLRAYADEWFHRAQAMDER